MAAVARTSVTLPIIADEDEKIAHDYDMSAIPPNYHIVYTSRKFLTKMLTPKRI
jgi:alkyl hydroperoxide reductase subunit AhpC